MILYGLSKPPTHIAQHKCNANDRGMGPLTVWLGHATLLSWRMSVFYIMANEARNSVRMRNI